MARKELLCQVREKGYVRDAAGVDPVKNRHLALTRDQKRQPHLPQVMALGLRVTALGYSAPAVRRRQKREEVRRIVEQHAAV